MINWCWFRWPSQHRIGPVITSPAEVILWTYWHVDWLKFWLADWLTDLMFGWLPDCLVDLVIWRRNEDWLGWMRARREIWWVVCVNMNYTTTTHSLLEWLLQILNLSSCFIFHIFIYFCVFSYIATGLETPQGVSVVWDHASSIILSLVDLQGNTHVEPATSTRAL